MRKLSNVGCCSIQESACSNSGFQGLSKATCDIMNEPKYQFNQDKTMLNFPINKAKMNEDSLAKASNIVVVFYGLAANGFGLTVV